MLPWVISGVLVVVGLIIIAAVISSLVVVVPPNRVAVFSGSGGGARQGYKVVVGGRKVRRPIIEKVDWMDLSTIAIDVSVSNAYCKGTIPLNVQGVANVKISSKEGILDNAIERFLGRPIEAVAKIAKETLEANLRGVLATLTPEEVNEDRLKFATTLIDEADDDMRTLGLELDVLKIQNVTDEVGYLESVGRRQTAQVLKEARVSEAAQRAEAEEQEAESRRRAEMAGLQADEAIIVQRNELRMRTADLEAEAVVKEQQALVAGEKARAIAEQELEQARIELQRRRLEADVITPARAKKEAAELEAKGNAASIIEDGTAQIEVFNRLVAQYKAAGPDAERIFVLNMLPDLVAKIVDTVNNVSIDRVSVIDGGNGTGNGGIPGILAQLPASVIKITEQIEAATGVNILSGLNRPLTAENPMVAETVPPTPSAAAE
jgi:flotillin